METHDQVQWTDEKEDSLNWFTIQVGEVIGPWMKAHKGQEIHVPGLEKIVQWRILQTLQHFHNEVMELENIELYNIEDNTDTVIKVKDLQAIFTRYGVGDKLLK